MSSPFTAVIYFHGMGSQRRLEETSRLIDSLDKHSRTINSWLAGVTCHVEPSLVVPDEMVQFIRTVHRPQNGSGSANPRSLPHVQFYEGYWAPITAKGVKPWTVFWWLLTQAFRPFTVLRSEWRTHARLRRAALRELHDMHLRLGPKRSFSEQVRRVKFWKNQPLIRMTASDVRQLLRAYQLFEGLGARRNFPDGKYCDFREFLDARLRMQLTISAAQRDVMLRAADHWRQHAFDVEIRNLFLLWTMLLFILVISLTGIVLASLFIASVQNSSFFKSLVEYAKQADGKSQDLFNITAPTLLAFIISAIGIPVFLQRYLGDVVFWCTYEETDVRFAKRREILDFGVKVIKHVIKNPKCERVVIVAHSLGTAIAHDVLLELGKDDWARTHNLAGFNIVSTQQLNKIEHFVTAGSPIDKIHYFFESDAGSSHRYVRVTDTLRGDMGRKPFGNNNNKPFLHWINFWDKADIISGSLESPPNATDTEVLVNNVEVSNGHLSPGAAHTTYFENDTVIDHLFKMIYRNEYSYHVLSQQTPRPVQNVNYAPANLSRGTGWKWTRLVQGIVLAMPWIAFIGLVYAISSVIARLVTR